MIFEEGRTHRCWYLSLSEVAKDEMVKGQNLLDPLNDDLLKAVLYKYGMDLGKHIEVQLCEHRNVFGEKVYCNYFFGTERNDSRWLSIKNALVTGTWRLPL